MSLPQQYDLVIVGGGLSGASLACALGDLGKRIAVIEAIPVASDKQPSYDERTIALTYSSRNIFSGIGVWQSISDAACPIHSIHISDVGKSGMTRLNRSLVDTEALGYVVPTRVVGTTLFDAIIKMPNIDWICPARAIGIEHHESNLTLELADAQTPISTPLVVVADGARSGIGQAAGLELDTISYPTKALITIIETDRFHEYQAFERFTRSGPLALLPMHRAGRWRYAVAWTLPEEEADRLTNTSESEFLAALQNEFGYRAGNFLGAGNRRSYPLSLGILENPARNRVVALGNAAHIVHPVAGQGFNLGLKDVAIFAEEVANAWRDNLDPGDPLVLNRYNRKRNRQTRRVGTFTNGLISTFTSTIPGVELLRNVGLNMLDLAPPAKRLLLKRTMGIHGRQPLLACGRPLGQSSNTDNKP
ncbi:MAG: 2-octaprenyl-6-methoxyphenol hydroxylase [Parasphingorhabdus sp.]